MDVEATPAHRTQEVESTKTMVDCVEQRFSLKPDRLVRDAAYGTGPMLEWMVEDKGIAPHVPVWDRSERKDGTLSSSEFQWNCGRVDRHRKSAMGSEATFRGYSPSVQESCRPCVVDLPLGFIRWTSLDGQLLPSARGGLLAPP